MESSASDEGEPAGPSSRYRNSFLLLVFLLACSKINQPNKSSLITEGRPRFTVKETFPEPPPKVVKKQKKKIYLTFDDGPNRGTQNVLDIVQQERVPATFFIVGEHVFASLQQAKTWDSLQHAENIEICNHSFTHAHNHYSKYYEQPGTVVEDMELTKEKLLPDNYVVRAPGRNSWRIDSLHFTDIKRSKEAMDSLQNAGFVVMGWDLEWHYDPKTLVVQNSADELLQQVDSAFSKGRTRTADHLILLAHDQVYEKSSDSTQLRQFVQKLKLKEEYELALVSSYPGVKNKE
jgi:peptidoglycan-N-acetylglucosamine deacetylase